MAYICTEQSKSQAFCFKKKIGGVAYVKTPWKSERKRVEEREGVQLRLRRIQAENIAFLRVSYERQRSSG